MVKSTCRVLLFGACATLLLAAGARAQDDADDLPDVPRTLPAIIRNTLERQRAGLDKDIDDLNTQIVKYNGRCASYRADDNATRSFCAAEVARLKPIMAALEARKQDFKNDVANAVANAARGKRGLDDTYVPSPEILKENQSLLRNPAQWLAAAQEAVRAAVKTNAERTRAILQAIDELKQPEPKYQLTKLSDLKPGDILLVAPVDVRRNVPDAALGHAIQGADYLVRVTSDLASKRALQAGQQTTAPVSHALTFVRDANGTFMFLDHTSVGSRILDDRQFLKEYGAREMYVARPNEIVDGRALWSAAATAVRHEGSDYGFFGKNVVCSERAGIAVARVTGTAPNHRVGPVDITPGDFFDTRGATGKHFAVTRLYITPTHPNE